MKKIPYGITNYKTLIEEDYYYVDKTMYLEKLEDVGSVLVYLRPRRFGKTLFTSMMEYYYDVNSKDIYDNLFKDTYVYKNPTKNKNNYYILKFDFSGISFYDETNEAAMKQFNFEVSTKISQFLNQYNISYKLYKTDNPSDTLLYFLSYFKSLNLNHKIYLMIDEYDHFVNGLLSSSNTSFYQTILGENGFVKDFYRTINKFSDSVIERVYLTGVCSVSLDTVTHGILNIVNISSEYIFNSMTALTHEEVKYLLKEIPNKDNHYHTIIKNYEGYLFHGKAEEKVFNPTLIMYYLNYAKHGLERLNLMDPNIISSYHQIQYIASLGNDKEILHDILYHGEVVSSLTLKIPLTAKYYKRDVVSLLYYLGYLSIQDFKDSKYHFVIPNQCMKRFYAEYYLSILKSDLKKSYDKEEIDLVHEVYEDGKLNKLCEYISQLLKDIDNQTFSNYTEKDLQIILYIILFRYSAFDVYLEYSINNNFIDLAIFTKKYNYLVELKYIKEKDKKSYDEVYQKAKEQIKKYTIHKDNLRKYIIIFTGSHYMLEEIM